MQQQVAQERAECHETGLLIFKDYCYALRRDDGVELWLEMDQIPSHLTERPVTALLHNKVMDSLEESVCIGGRDAQTDTAEVPHDQLVRI